MSGPINKEIVEMTQYQDRVMRDPDEYFKRFDKLLPNNLTSDHTILLYKIDNIGVIEKIIERNPNAKYTVFGNKFVNEMLKKLDYKNIIKYINSTIKVKDKHSIDYKAFDYSCFERSPEASKAIDFLKIGLKVGQKISLISYDGKKEYASWKIYDNRHLIDQSGKVASLGYFLVGFVRQGNFTDNSHKDKYLYPSRRIFKHGIALYADLYPAYAMVDDVRSVHDYHNSWASSLCVTKNR